MGSRRGSFRRLKGWGERFRFQGKVCQDEASGAAGWEVKLKERFGF